MTEHNQNALRVESDGDPASGSLAVTAAPPLAEYDSGTGMFITRARAPRPVEPVPVRHRHDGWTPARQRQFLEELADCGIVKEAAARVGMSAKGAWQLRGRAEGTPFASAWEAALQAGTRRLHAVAFERAVEGVARPLYYRGEKVGEQRVYDNRLLLSLLGKAGLPFDDARAAMAGRRWEAYLEAVEQGYEQPQPRLETADDEYVWTDEDGTWWTLFPPPGDCSVTEQGEYGDAEYCRTLSPVEHEALTAELNRQRARDCAERDRFFGLEK